MNTNDTEQYCATCILTISEKGKFLCRSAISSDQPIQYTHKFASVSVFSKLPIEPLLKEMKALKPQGFVTRFRTPRQESNIATSESSWSPLCLISYRIWTILMTRLNVVILPPPTKLSGFHQSQKRPLVKVGWTCPPQFIPQYSILIWF